MNSERFFFSCESNIMANNEHYKQPGDINVNNSSLIK